MSRGSALGLSLFLTSLLLLSANAGAVGRVVGPAGFTLTISATPSPSDPLLITFVGAAVTGTVTSYRWSFGDGQYFNGSGAAFAQPVHRSANPGVYSVGLTAFEGNQSATQLLPLTVQPAGLSVAILPTAATGSVPLTVTFQAVLSGGTGTFGSVLWSFGDGGSGVGTSIAYTFVRAGHFPVSVQVIDSAGQQADARGWVNVSAPAGTLSGPGPLPLPVLAGTLALLAGLGALGAGLWLARRGRFGFGAKRPTDGTEARAGASPLETEADTREPSGGALLPTVPAPERPGEPSPGGTARRGAFARRRGTGETSRPIRRDPGGPRLSQRIILHLRDLGRLEATEVAPVGFSQLGMSDRLGVRQNALTNVLRRLVAAGVLLEEVRHVQGQPRRLKVYRLTPRGEALAKDLRERSRPSGPVPAPETRGDAPGPTGRYR